MSVRERWQRICVRSGAPSGLALGLVLGLYGVVGIACLLGCGTTPVNLDNADAMVTDFSQNGGNPSQPGGDGSAPGNDGVAPGGNNGGSSTSARPIARAGDDIQVRVGQQVTLDGSASEVFAGSASYAWRQISGPDVALNGADQPIATFTPPQPGEYVFELTVTDGEGRTAQDTVQVTVLPALPAPPVADAGPDASAVIGDTVVLDGSASQGSGLSYMWEQVVGPAVVLSDADQAIASFQALAVGDYEFRLTVTDSQGRASSDSVAIRIDLATGQNVVSTFDDGDDGWRVVGNNVTRPVHHETGGRPGGFVYIVDDSGETIYWSAPAKFLGDRVAAYGRWLRFDLTQSSSSYPLDAAEIILSGGGIELYFNADYHPLRGWTSYRIPLVASKGWRRSADDELATEADLITVLGSLDKMLIRAEYIWGEWPNEKYGLDNVVLDLGSDPPPVEKAQNVISHFDRGDHGWTAIGNNQIGASVPVWHDTGGRWNSDGYVSIVDASGETIYWDAPPDFLGNVSRAYGRSLSFSLSQSSTSDQSGGAGDVILRGAGITIYAYVPNSPTQGWRAYRVPLIAGTRWRRWVRDGNPDEPATEDEIKAVLSSLDQILIRGEYRRSDDNYAVGLDEVVLDLGSEPSPEKQVNVVSDFESPDHGWTAIGNGQIGASVPEFHDTGGRWGTGCAAVRDRRGGEVIYWDAPPAFLGNVSRAYGRSLQFSLSQLYTDDQFESWDVILRGGGLTIYYDTASNPMQGWTAYRVPLKENAGWIRQDNGEPAVEADIRRVLGALDQLLIRAEYRRPDDDWNGIDHVVLDLGSGNDAAKSASVATDFSDQNHGWTAIGNNTILASPVEWHATGGPHSVDGYIRSHDLGSGTVYWEAPPPYLGNLSNAYGGTLRYWLRQSNTSDQFDAWDVILRGGGLVLHYHTSRPASAWTEYAIPLEVFRGWERSDGEVATEEEIRQVLGALDQILIRAEYFRTVGESNDLGAVELEMP